MARPSRPELLEALHALLRKVSAQSVLISDTVAGRVGLNSTDLECLDLLTLAGPTTAGRLAAHSGLTTGAMTAVLDRLEAAGFVRRRRDTVDRRRVQVEALPRSVALIAPYYAPLAARTEALNAGYDDRALATVVDYMSRALAIGSEHVAWLQRQEPLRRAGAKGATRRAAVSRPPARGERQARRHVRMKGERRAERQPGKPK